MAWIARASLDTCRQGMSDIHKDSSTKTQRISSSTTTTAAIYGPAGIASGICCPTSSELAHTCTCKHTIDCNQPKRISDNKVREPSYTFPNLTKKKQRSGCKPILRFVSAQKMQSNQIARFQVSVQTKRCCFSAFHSQLALIIFLTCTKYIGTNLCIQLQLNFCFLQGQAMCQ